MGSRPSQTRGGPRLLLAPLYAVLKPCFSSIPLTKASLWSSQQRLLPSLLLVATAAVSREVAAVPDASPLRGRCRAVLVLGVVVASGTSQFSFSMVLPRSELGIWGSNSYVRSRFEDWRWIHEPIHNFVGDSIFVPILFWHPGWTFPMLVL